MLFWDSAVGISQVINYRFLHCWFIGNGGEVADSSWRSYDQQFEKSHRGCSECLLPDPQGQVGPGVAWAGKNAKSQTIITRLLQLFIIPLGAACS